jgi:hypothetical protein
MELDEKKIFIPLIDTASSSVGFYSIYIGKENNANLGI